MIENDASIRLVIFLIVLCAMGASEILWPMLKNSSRRQVRWKINAALMVVYTLILKLLVPLLATGFAVVVQTNQLGLMNNVTLPAIIEAAIVLICLDGFIYAQHVLFHRIPLLWAIHQVHHSDTVLDVTTALRFHPIEIVLSMVFKFSAILILGASPAVVLIFEIILNASAMFNHSNVRIPRSVDRYVRMIIVTPCMHRVHHSVDLIESQRNYGFALSLWDRLFRTYLFMPESQLKELRIGIGETPSSEDLSLWQCLVMPFVKAK